MKKSILLTAGLLFVVSCAGVDTGRRDATTTGTGGWIFEGWGGPPVQSNDGKTPKDTTPKDWYYMKFGARASAKAVAKKSQMMMLTTCREAARVQGANAVIQKMVGETLESASGVSDGESIGQVIISETKGLVKGVGAYDCKAVGPGSDPKDESKDNWEECMCVIYAKFPGGQDALVATAKKVEEKN